MLRGTVVLSAPKYSHLHVLDKAPVTYDHVSYSRYAPKAYIPKMNGSMLWRKFLKEKPRVYKWERTDPPVHMQKFHRQGVEWGRTRCQYLTVGDEEWPKVVLKSEAMQMRDLESKRGALRFQTEGLFGALRQGQHCLVPNNYPIIERHRRCLNHAYFLKDKYQEVPRFHPKPDELLDFEL
eukprot:Rhum_TRINITY_DN23188_c0_g1::Rhum_TRINITY_DN23188_c0_g1_i1::g.177333::m.177333